VSGPAYNPQRPVSSTPDTYRADLCTGCIIAAHLNNTIIMKLKSVNDVSEVCYMLAWVFVNTVIILAG